MKINEDNSLFDNYNNHFAVLFAEIHRLRAVIGHLKFLAHRGDHNQDLQDFWAIEEHAQNAIRPDNSILEEQPDYPGEVFQVMGLWPSGMNEVNPRHIKD